MVSPVSPAFFRLFSPLMLLLVTGSVTVDAQVTTEVAPPIPSEIDLQDGDTLVFLGDSITHQRLYTQYVEDFFYTRFPDRRIRFHNAGVGGARAWDALQRLSRDVLDYEPRYVTILLGMNDGSYRAFDSDTFTTYQSDMLQLVERIRAGGAVPILMSPTMFDSRAAKRANRWQPDMLAQYNAVLAYYGKWLQHEAIERGLSFVDMFGPLNNLTIDQRKSNASFTMIKDAVHPDPPGQLVMAYSTIDHLGLRRPLSSIRIVPTARGQLRTVAKGGIVTDLVQARGRMEFDWTADALPWVVPEEAQLGVELVKLGHRASREALTIHGLEAGTWELSIDGTTVGKWPHTVLASHVELQGNQLTPQYQQAMEVALLNKQRNDGPVKSLRDGWRAFQNWARQSRELARQPNNAELAGQVVGSRAKLDEFESVIRNAEARARKIEDKIFATNQPITRHYELTRLAR
jgi:lysophospholipase L1-like esterase